MSTAAASSIGAANTSLVKDSKLQLKTFNGFRKNTSYSSTYSLLLDTRIHPFTSISSSTSPAVIRAVSTVIIIFYCFWILSLFCNIDSFLLYDFRFSIRNVNSSRVRSNVNWSVKMILASMALAWALAVWLSCVIDRKNRGNEFFLSGDLDSNNTFVCNLVSLSLREWMHGIWIFRCS